MQPEWRALSGALRAHTNKDRRRGAADAVLFRAERYRLFPSAKAEEQSYEMHERLAEYTGVVIGKSRRLAVALDCRELGRKLVVSCE